MIVLPLLPQARGPDPRRAAFFTETACAFEIMALWHSLSAEAQETLREAFSAAAASAAQARADEKK